MMTRTIRHTLLACCLPLLGACASDPPTLLALPAPAPMTGTLPATDVTVLLRPAVIPRYLDNLSVVTRRAGGDVAVAPGAEWAERLGDGANRVLAGALDARLGPGNLLIAGDGRIPDADLSVEITRMDPADGRLLLQARWTLVGGQGGERPVRAGSESLEVPLAGDGPSGVANATTVALTRLADNIAAAVRSFPVRRDRAP